MTRSNKKQPTDKKPVVANSKLWREIPEGLQGKVGGGITGDSNNKMEFSIVTGNRTTGNIARYGGAIASDGTVIVTEI